MAVYVDDCRVPFRGMRMSHMTADTLGELHEMADKIGLKREWFQDGSVPHYDVCDSKRVLAIGEGAVSETVVEGVFIEGESMDCSDFKPRYVKRRYGMYDVYADDTDESWLGYVRKTRMTSGSATWWKAYDRGCEPSFVGTIVGEAQTREAAARCLL